MNTIIEDEYGNLHTINDSIATELLQRGVIRHRDDGTLVANEADLNNLPERFPWLCVCDFCSERPAAWNIIVEDFSLDGPVKFESVGGWLACEPCGTFIKSGKSEQLARRVNARLGPLPDDARAIVNVFHTQMLDAFWQHFKRIERITPRPFGH